MLINELSKLTGVSAHTIRFYEKSGLIKGNRIEGVTTNKYFHYTQESVDKLELIRDAKSVGFTLSEIGNLMDAWYNKKFTVKQKLAVLDAKLISIEDKIKQLKEVKKTIATFKKEIIIKNC